MYQNYSSPEFEEKYTYTGTDLGATWSKEQTFFRVWAPAADFVTLNLYRSGDSTRQDLLEAHPMLSSDHGTWTVTVEGDWNGVYYTYTVSRGESVSEAVDPYARAVGVNGKRSMVVDLASTNPEGWDRDQDPNAGKPITDCVIYELHVRDLSADPSSGITHKGKFLGLTEAGTTTRDGHPTGLDHIKSLGITHLHLLPAFDYGSVDEADPKNRKYNWGYDPENFNVPEGSYATDPCDGAVRIREMKQMIAALHENGISVVMDVVYNHVYHTFEFCVNQLVPGYFSRQDDSGCLSNGSGCGNDTASERSMVRKYIVDSVCFWADEYHIDGFRFDLVGLIDVQTVNEIMAAVKKKHPNVIFYGEGWDLATQVTKPDVPLAVQRNAHRMPGFAFFNDTIRDTMRGSVFYCHEKGFASDGEVSNDHLLNCFCGRVAWTSDPRQVVNYVSCHDNHTLHDRIAEALPRADHAELARRCRLTAAFTLLSSGIPFFQAGEEMLRSKKSVTGKYIANSYRSSDHINAIKWNRLGDGETAATVRYYRGLLALRRKYDHFRMGDPTQIAHSICALPTRIPAFLIHGSQQRLLCVFHAGTTPAELELPIGNWDILVNDTTAGTESLGSVSEKLVIPPLSAFVLVQQRIR